MKNKQNTEHYFWGENCDSWILQNSENLVVKQEKMPPQTSEKLHYHEKAQQFFFILNGEATFYLEDEKVQIKSGEGISISPNKKHKIANETSEDLEFLVISSSRTENDRILV